MLMYIKLVMILLTPSFIILQYTLDDMIGIGRSIFDVVSTEQRILILKRC